MIAISSFRRHEKNAEYAANQIRAANSWSLFSKAFYFGSYEQDLQRENVLFAKCDEGFPRIRDMAEFASHCEANQLVCIINADIVVTAPILEVERKMIDLTVPAATSYRYEFDPSSGDLNAAVRNKQDRGMDLFCCLPHVWGQISRHIPDYLRIGHPTWDTWVCGFLCSNFGFGFRQFTDYRCVFHPKHGGRKMPHSEEIRSNDEYFTRAHVPSPL